MNLLIITQKVDKNAPILGFFHRWLKEFSKHFDKVIVVCLEKGDYDLPNNVEILSMGKEHKKSRLQYLFRFYKYIFSRRKDYDSVFVHMCPIYMILGGIFWKIMNKKVSLWYTHSSVTFKLRLAKILSDTIFTASKGSFSLKTDKLSPVGHGIDTDNFSLKNNFTEKVKKIIAVGRIASVKNYEELIRAADKIEYKIKIEIIGSPRKKEDEEYKERLKKKIKDKNFKNIEFIGSLPNSKIYDKYKEADILVNSSDTDSVDKVVLEAMSTGVIPITSNDSFRDILKDYSEICLYSKRDSGELAEKITRVVNLSETKREKLVQALRSIVINNHNIEDLIRSIKNKLRKIS